jgi:hypothetical protein
MIRNNARHGLTSIAISGKTHETIRSNIPIKYMYLRTNSRYRLNTSRDTERSITDALMKMPNATDV